MKTLVALFVLACLIPGAAHAKIYKCVEKGKVTYSNSPCPSGVSGGVLELYDSGKEDGGITLSAKPAPSVSTGEGAIPTGVPPGASPDVLDALKNALFGKKAQPQTGETPATADAVMKQIELLIRQRDPGNNTAERSGAENSPEGY
ncbi:MAG: DUF4124 domain-containing protein [Candidatus Accumulibacter sp.]|jgi:hypothetical protein|nr:DUF4124 domain-containing protein [Accumulibacter sp.]